MKPRYVFDTGVLALYFAGDRRVKQYFVKVFQGKAEGYISELNLAELYYKTIEKLGAQAAETRYMIIRKSKIKILPLNENITRTAAKLKHKYRDKLSLVDCYTLALAKEINATIITTDPAIKEVKETRTILISL